MTVLYIEPIGGIAGDMFLAAAVDLGVPVAELAAPLETLGLPPFSLVATRTERHHIGATHLEVRVPGGHADHHHRSLTDILGHIRGSSLPQGAKARAEAVFEAVGRVEARIHQVPIEEIHFHEVGAVDSIVDICGAALVLHLLGEPEVYALPPVLGSGTVKAAHGPMPVPAPATLALLEGCPVRYEGMGECTTPTGAALLKAWARFEAPALIPRRVGYGAGTRDSADRPNLLRLTHGEALAPPAALLQLEVNLDDCTPQVLGHALERLLEAGALDVWLLPAVMKKQRPGHLLGLLVPAGALQAIETTVFSELPTLGLRKFPISRTVLTRRHEQVETPFGPIRMKLGFQDAHLRNAAPEFDDCRAAALTHGVALREVMDAARRAWERRTAAARD